MPGVDKKTERERKAKAFRDLAKGLAGVSGMIQKPTASGIFDSLSGASLNERYAASSQLARETLFAEDPLASPPDELSDKAISEYLESAGDLYGGAASDYVMVSDLPMAFKYFRKAAVLYQKAAELAREDENELAERARQYSDKAAMVRQQIASRSIRRRKWSLGFLARLR